MCDDSLSSGGFPFAEATDTVVLPYPERLRSKTPRGCLTLWVVLTLHTLFSSVHAYLCSSSIYKPGRESD